ncbi:MAG: HAMP domain-containing histidine kinase, partial [Sphingobacteriaceae bacterium]
RFLGQVVRVQTHEAPNGAGSLLLVQLGVIGNGFADAVVGIVCGIVAQHVQDEAFLDGLAHTVEVKRLVLTLGVGLAEYLERFALMASHDIKSPLTSIMLTGQMLKSKYHQSLDGKGNQMLDIINSSANRLLDFLNQMLEYSKSYKILTQKKDEICVNELIEEVLKLVTLPESFRIETPVNLLYIKTSAIALEQILINLLNNAVRYNDKSEGFIKLEVEEKADFYQFRISDNGVGIEVKNFDKIFEPMITLNSRDRYNKAGSGIGLSTVKNHIWETGS